MNRRYGSLAAPEIAARLTENSVLCLPIGSYEQHGPHLPVDTDTVIAEQFTRRLVERYGDQHDLWALPVIPYGLSLERAWSPGTISLRAGLLTALLDIVVGEYMRATAARRLLIVNGHGGNRGSWKRRSTNCRRRTGPGSASFTPVPCPQCPSSPPSQRFMQA